MIIKTGKWERKMKEKIEWIDITKGLLIALVVLGHISLTREIDGGVIRKPSYMIENIWSGIMCWIYACHIPGFFIVNGILKNRTKYQTKDYDIRTLLSKQRRVLTYYLFFSSVFFVRYILQAIVGHDEWNDVLSFAYNTCTLVGMGVLWFLPTFFISQVLFHIYIKGNFLIRGGLLVLTILSFVSTYIWGINNIMDSMDVMVKLIGVLSRSLIALSFVILGYYFDKKKLFEFKYVFIGFISVFSYTNGIVDMNKLLFNNLFLFYMYAILGFMFVVLIARLICKYLNFIKQVVSFWGRESLFIMCTHTVLLVIHASIFVSIKITNIFWINIILAFVMTMLVESYIAYKYHIVLNKCRLK